MKTRQERANEFFNQIIKAQFRAKEQNIINEIAGDLYFDIDSDERVWDTVQRIAIRYKNEKISEWATKIIRMARAVK